MDPVLLAAAPELTVIAGHLAESTVGATLSTIGGLDLAHYPQRGTEPEVDFVLTIGTHRIPVEVEYQAAIDPVRDIAGLNAFLARTVNRAPFGVLVTRNDVGQHPDPQIVALPLSSLMLLR